MFVVDASVWVARYRPADVNHRSSATWLRRTFAQGIPIYAPSLVLPEITGPISRAAGEVGARRLLSEVTRLHRLQLVPLGYELAIKAARLAAQFRLRGADSVYVAVASQLGMPLVTWDREQHDRASSIVSVRTPTDLLGANA